MTAHVLVDTHPAARVTVHVPSVGPWWADVVFETAPDVSGVVTIRVGELELVGTIDPTHDGVRGLERRSRIVAGAGGWGTLLAPKAYHNDAGVKASTVAEDAAREAGETLGDFAPVVERIGIDYVRESGPASRTLEDVIGAVPWWVGYDGVTRVGARGTSTPVAGSFDVLEHVVDERLVTLAADDLRSVGIGSILTDGLLETPQTVSELELAVEPDSVRIKAWCGDGSRGGRLVGILRSIVGRATDGELHGLWKYRVVQMSSERVELQAVTGQRDGLPNVIPVSQWPGMAGLWASLAPGSEVLVQFVAGRRTEPVVTHFSGRDGAGWEPVELVLAAQSLRLGAVGASEGVPFGDSLKSYIDAHVHAYVDSTAGNLLTSPPTTNPAGTPLDPSPSPSSRVTVA